MRSDYKFLRTWSYKPGLIRGNLLYMGYYIVYRVNVWKKQAHYISIFDGEEWDEDMLERKFGVEKQELKALIFDHCIQWMEAQSHGKKET